MHTFLCEDGEGQFVLLSEQVLPEDIEIELIEVEEVDKAELERILKPLPNMHSCDLRRGTKFSTYRVAHRESGGKRYQILYGKIAGSSKWVEASFRYSKGIWQRSAAAGHCKRHGGHFIAATGTQKSETDIDKVKIHKKDAVEGLVYGVVLEPYVPDSYHDFEKPAEIRATAHRFMIHLGEELKSRVGIEHEEPVNAIPVESFTAPQDFWYDGTPHTEEYKVSKDSWVLVTQVLDKNVLEDIHSGEYRGYSVQGWGRRKPVIPEDA